MTFACSAFATRLQESARLINERLVCKLVAQNFLAHIRSIASASPLHRRGLETQDSLTWVHMSMARQRAKPQKKHEAYSQSTSSSSSKGSPSISCSSLIFFSAAAFSFALASFLALRSKPEAESFARDAEARTTLPALHRGLGVLTVFDRLLRMAGLYTTVQLRGIQSVLPPVLDPPDVFERLLAEDRSSHPAVHERIIPNYHRDVLVATLMKKALCMCSFSVMA